MFFVDKYRPQTADESHFHKNLITKFKKMCEDDQVPHMIFHGPSGGGKMTLINIFLNMLFGDKADDIKGRKYIVSGSSGAGKEVNVQESSHHIVVEPQGTNFDKYMIQEVIKKFARMGTLGINRSYRVVVITDIDRMTFYSQTALRRTIEKYSRACRFIMCSRSSSKVIDPLLSRCMSIRVPLPLNSELFKFLCYISAEEGLNKYMKMEDYLKIVNKSDNNIKEAVWMLELFNLGIDSKTAYETSIDSLITMMMKKSEDIATIRKLIYNVLITDIPCAKISHDILNKLLTMKKISDEKKGDIMRIISRYDHNMVRSRREIYHIEAIIQKIINVL